jgi:signal transduction histidine kinase
MNKTPSLRKSLITTLTAVYAAALIVVVIGYLVIAWTTKRIEVVDLTNDISQEIGNALKRLPSGEIILDPQGTVISQLKRIPDGAYRVQDEKTGKILLSEGTIPEDLKLPDASWELNGTYHPDNNPSRFVSISKASTAIGNVRIIFLRGDITNSDLLPWVEDELLEDMLPALIPIFLVSLIAVWITVRRVLFPLVVVSQKADQIGKDNQSIARLTEQNVPEEILPLIHAVNEAFNRVDSMLVRQRRFTANAAHELRTPLAVLRVCIDNLVVEPAKGELTAETDRLSRRVNQLLALAKLEENKVSFEEIDLNHLAGKVTAYLVPLALKQGKSLEFFPSQKSISIIGDAFMLEDAVRNLIENALRYAPADTAVEISVKQDARLQVRDHGPGIRSDDIERIFEPFWRGDTKMGDGAGLGLSIVRHTASLHKAQIVAANHPEGGAIFTLNFAAAQA